MTTKEINTLQEILGTRIARKEALLQMDKNTVNYMIEEMKKEVDELHNIVAEKDNALAEKDALIAELQKQLAQTGK